MVVRQIVLNPLIMSAAAGALAAALHIHPPVAIDNTLLFLQNAAAPVALFVLGVTVALRPFGRVPWEVPGVIAVKLLIHPLIVFGLMLLFGPFAQPWAATAVLMASLPPALNVFVIARQHDTWIEPASVAVLIGTFASVDHADQRDVVHSERPAGVSVDSSVRLADRHDGARPSRMARRRSGPIEPIRCRPAARSDCIGRKSLSNERFAMIDREGPAGDIGAPRRIVALQHLRRAGILARQHRLPHDIGDIGGIAQSHVQALRADRRQHMGGFADQRDTRLARIVRGCSIASGNRCRPGSTVMRPRMECDCRLRGLGQFVVAQAPSAVRLPSGAATHTTLQRLPGSGTNTHGPCGV